MLTESISQALRLSGASATEAQSSTDPDRPGAGGRARRRCVSLELRDCARHRRASHSAADAERRRWRPWCAGQAPGRGRWKAARNRREVSHVGPGQSRSPSGRKAMARPAARRRRAAAGRQPSHALARREPAMAGRAPHQDSRRQGGAAGVDRWTGSSDVHGAAGRSDRRGRVPGHHLPGPREHWARRARRRT